jgi:hypothetical protein
MPNPLTRTRYGVRSELSDVRHRAPQATWWPHAHRCNLARCTREKRHSAGRGPHRSSGHIRCGLLLDRQRKRRRHRHVQRPEVGPVSPSQSAQRAGASPATLRGGAIAIRGAARLTHRVLLERTDGCRSQSARSVEAAARRIARQRRRGQPDRIRPVVGRAFQQEMRVSCFNVDISVPYVAAISRSCVAGETVTSSRHLVDNTARLQRRAWGIFWT